MLSTWAKSQSKPKGERGCEHKNHISLLNTEHKVEVHVSIIIIKSVNFMWKEKFCIVWAGRLAHCPWLCWTTELHRVAATKRQFLHQWLESLAAPPTASCSWRLMHSLHFKEGGGKYTNVEMERQTQGAQTAAEEDWKWKKKKVEEMREAEVERERGKLKKRGSERVGGWLTWGERERERGEVMRPVTGFTPRLCGN